MKRTALIQKIIFIMMVSFMSRCKKSPVEIRPFTELTHENPATNTTLASMIFSPTGSKLAVHRWKMKDSQAVFSYENVLGSEIQIWDVRAEVLVTTIEAENLVLLPSLWWNLDETRIITSGQKAASIQFWDTTRGSLSSSVVLDQDIKSLRTPVISLNAGLLAVMGELSSASSISPVVILIDLATEKQIQRWMPSKDTKDLFFSGDLIFSADGKRLAVNETVVNGSVHLRLWNTKTMQGISFNAGNGPQGQLLSFVQDDDHILVQAYGQSSSALETWTISSATLDHRFSVSADQQISTLSDDGTRVLVHSERGDAPGVYSKISLWDTETGTMISARGGLPIQGGSLSGFAPLSAFREKFLTPDLLLIYAVSSLPDLQEYGFTAILWNTALDPIVWFGSADPNQRGGEVVLSKDVKRAARSIEGKIFLYNIAGI